MASSKPPEMNYTCEICGLEGFNDEEMRSHMVLYHLQGAANCPFCDLGEISPTEMLVHVNSAHLDYLTPSSDSPLRLEEHINRQHFDLTSPSFPPESPPSRDGVFNCPLCVTSFPNSSDLELHVNIEHKDILSPANGTTSQSDIATIGSDTPACPVCLSTLFKNNDDLMAHIEEHFSKKSTPSPVTPDVSTDRMLAKDMERREKEVRKLREQREFEMLRAQYGMDNQGNFREQSVTNMQRAVYAGEMTVADFFERQIELRVAESSGIDDGSSCTRGLVPKVRAVSQACSNVVNTWMCSTVDHYASTYGDKGWGCGYRNMQMLISSLLQHTGYNELVYKAWSSGAGGNSSTESPLRTSMPSISRLQKMIEWAWTQGFDIQGAEQLGGKLVNTRKWIGATEVFTLLSSLRIKCQLVDFHRPTSADGGHPELFNWVLQYFQRCDDFKPPLYLQHQGHSRTIMGVEQLRDGSIIMVVLDPSHSPAQMSHFNSTSSAPGAMRLVRKSTAAMKARQYQVVAVTGTMDTEAQYQVITTLNHLVIYRRHACSIFTCLSFSLSLSPFLSFLSLFSKVKFYDQCVFLKTGESCWFEKQASSRLEAQRL
ncbi:Zinc finger with UFM1-specific peptidase domain protein [Harpegnathos saltator]|uniref:Zinc finger-containing ubiquitin peptidase 1 n=1 Tax=Harpegnathos saltator TaxID=610380 RepID=E2BQ79_HARSA|nr:Zinc finger with UFM1-specific peptidase domain protein [Harpegnathos saltator]